jgi:hypothetical protein
MPNVMTNPTNFQRRINNYVPAMMYSADVNYNAGTRVNFGAPAVNASTGLLGATSIAAAASFDLSAATISETYGRCLQIVASGAATSTNRIDGWDYLGQPMSETFTLNGATPVQGKKAFKTLSQMVVLTTTGATTVTLGLGTGLGLPYKALRVQFEVANGALAAAGTLTGAILTDPQTATTGDPRGTYVATTTLNASNIISAVFDFVNDVNTSNNGGLHGVRQFAA